jgi:hypothetical protein
MGKNTNILIGAGALAVVYYLYNASKASASVSPNGGTLPPISTNPPPPDYKPLPIREQLPPATKDCVVGTYNCVTTRYETIQIPIDADCSLYQPENPPCLEREDYNKVFFEKRELDRIEAEKAAELAKAELERLAREQAESDRIAAAEAERQKAMNAFMYPTCPDGFEFYQNNCMPTYLIVEEKAKKGEGLVLRDFKSNTTTLVQTCPDEYVKQGINCIPRYSLSPQALQVLAMEESGMVQTSDGQWYTNAAAAATAQALIDAQTTQYSSRAYSARQKSINDAICSIDRDGFINNPYSTYTNGMSLNQYIGEFKVLAGELGIARATCPNSPFSIGSIAGGRPDDMTLGYK